MAVPLVTVIAISMVKDIFEDYKRHQSDNKENRTKSKRYFKAEKRCEDIMWKDIKVG